VSFFSRVSQYDNIFFCVSPYLDEEKSLE